MNIAFFSNNGLESCGQRHHKLDSVRSCGAGYTIALAVRPSSMPANQRAVVYRRGLDPASPFDQPSSWSSDHGQPVLKTVGAKSSSARQHTRQPALLSAH